MDERQIQLDHVGAQQRHERQRAGVGADVVERDAPAARARRLDGRQQLRQAVGQRPLGQLDHAAEVASQLRQAPEAAGVGLGVDEQGQRALDGQPRGGRHGGGPARRIELTEATRGARGPEQLIRMLEWRSEGPARQGLKADDVARLQIHERLEDRAQETSGEDVGERREATRRRIQPLGHASRMPSCAPCCK